jgi:hypothetical protein
MRGWPTQKNTFDYYTLLAAASSLSLSLYSVAAVDGQQPAVNHPETTTTFIFKNIEDSAVRSIFTKDI